MAKLSSTSIYGNLTVDGEITNKATTTSEGVVKLNDSIDSSSVTEAATANAVKKINDKIAAMGNNKNFLSLDGGKMNPGAEITFKMPKTDGGWARGLNYNSTDGSTNVGTIGFFGSGSNISNIHLGLGKNPWEGKNSLIIEKNNIKFNNYDIYHKGKKPTAQEVGALPLSGGVLTGSISYSAGGTTVEAIKFKNGEDGTGHQMALGADGMTIIGSGESSTVLTEHFSGSDKTTEYMIVGSDLDIYLMTNLQNGYSNRKELKINSKGEIERFEENKDYNILHLGDYASDTLGWYVGHRGSTAGNTGNEFEIKSKYSNNVRYRFGHLGNIKINKSGTDYEVYSALNKPIPKDLGAPTVNAGAVSFKIGGSGQNITTAQFIDLLEKLGALNKYYWIGKGEWWYAGSDTITDTGCGNIHLAGAVVEVFGQKEWLTIRITTPTTTSAGGEANAEFIYIDHGATYQPGWRKMTNSKSVGSVIQAGGNKVDTTQPNDYAGLDRKNNLNLETWWGFSVTTSCPSQLVSTDKPAFSVDARIGDAYVQRAYHAQGVYIDWIDTKSTNPTGWVCLDNAGGGVYHTTIRPNQNGIGNLGTSGYTWDYIYVRNNMFSAYVNKERAFNISKYADTDSMYEMVKGMNFYQENFKDVEEYQEDIDLKNSEEYKNASEEEQKAMFKNIERKTPVSYKHCKDAKLTLNAEELPFEVAPIQNSSDGTQEIDGGAMTAALAAALQKTIEKIELLEEKIFNLENTIDKSANI